MVLTKITAGPIAAVVAVGAAFYALGDAIANFYLHLLYGEKQIYKFKEAFKSLQDSLADTGSDLLLWWDNFWNGIISFDTFKTNEESLVNHRAYIDKVIEARKRLEEFRKTPIDTNNLDAYLKRLQTEIDLLNQVAAAQQKMHRFKSGAEKSEVPDELLRVTREIERIKDLKSQNLLKDAIKEIGEIPAVKSPLEKFIDSDDTIQRLNKIKEILKDVQKATSEIIAFGPAQVKITNMIEENTASIAERSELLKKRFELTEQLTKLEKRMEGLKTNLEKSLKIEDFVLHPIRKQVLQLQRLRDELLVGATKEQSIAILNAYQRQLREIVKVQPVAGVAATEYSTQEQVSMMLAARREREADTLTKQMAIDVENKNANQAVEKNTRDINKSISDLAASIKETQEQLNVVTF